MVNVRKLTPALQKIATDELNEDPDRIEKDLEDFRNWIKKSPHIIARDDDQFLVNFLRGCKYSMERVKQKFDLYHTMKTHVPELTRNRDPLNEKILEAIRLGVGIPLPNLEKEDGPRYFLVRPGCYDPSKYTIEDIIKVSTMVGEMMMQEDDNFVVTGQVGILDFSGVTMASFLQFNPTFIKKMSMVQQDAAPIRQKASHFVNMPSIALTVFNLFQSFTSEKNKKRVKARP
jgi:CRAL/TRIO domain